ncbi:hypothetical protein MSPP1_002011 [Malassezia sp. CBS 17886]|nr:hypothetical protein MSPP1_002011 [Malassezia sp. CBS 17886]
MNQSATGASTGATPSRFVKETELSDAQKKREEDMKDAYERIGEEPPPETAAPAEPYDGRCLYEEQSQLKQEKFEERFKLANQYRGLDEYESMFLTELADARDRKETDRKREEANELDAFRKCVNTRVRH